MVGYFKFVSPTLAPMPNRITNVEFTTVSPTIANTMLCGRPSISVGRFIVNYSNLSLLEWVDILLSRSYNKHNIRPLLALTLSYNSHTRKNIGMRLSALFRLFYVHTRGKL
jgi:hypothetical protein